ncbi:MAG: hypothetical protein AAF363_14880 [Bacteroidota bacterium]
MDIVTRNHIDLLIQLAKVDQNLCEKERKVINRIAVANNFPQSEVELMIENPRPMFSLGALSINKKLDYIISLVELMLADEKILQSEMLFCTDIAIKLGFKKDVIDYLKTNVEFTPEEELKNSIREQYL